MTRIREEEEACTCTEGRHSEHTRCARLQACTCTEDRHSEHTRCARLQACTCTEGRHSEHTMCTTPSMHVYRGQTLWTHDANYSAQSHKCSRQTFTCTLNDFTTRNTFELNKFAVVKMYSSTVKFPKVVRQQIWGQVVGSISACFTVYLRIRQWKNY